MLRSIVALFLLFLSLSVKAQLVSDSKQRALDSLLMLKPLFQKSSNDSAFIAQYSDESFRFYHFVRGDQAQDIEEQVYSTKEGDVAGPFRGEGNLNYLFKVISYEGFTARTKASLVYLKSEDGKQDTIALKKVAQKYAKSMAQGKSIKEQAAKDKVRLVTTDLGYFFEDQKDKEYYHLVFNANGEKTYVLHTVHGPAILVIDSTKVSVPYKVKLIGVVKKG